MKMPKMLTLPKIGVNMTEALIVEWLVKEGDSIREGDHIIDAETDKAVQEIYSTMSGIIGRILVRVGEMATCQGPIAILLEPGERLESESPSPITSTNRETQTAESAVKISAGDGHGNNSSGQGRTDGGTMRLRISPLAKRTAAAMGIDWKSLSPSRPGARIVRADVLAFASSGAIKAAPDRPRVPIGTSIPYSGLRRIIGERMSDSARTKPSATLTLRADVGKLIAWREDLARKGISAGYTEMLVMIVARALRDHPLLNSTLVGDEIRLAGEINIGIAVDTDRGLYVPVIRNADGKGLIQIGDELRKKAEAAKAGRAGVDDLTGGTFTVTNLGMYEIESFTPIINPPECCILGAGAIQREPVVREDGEIGIASRMRLTLVFDHRIVDGAPAAKFFQRVKHLLEQPMDLFL
jgi:pyruvate dehydrogenase E2 component (dihydrolipoamide acetyltransferase)